MAHVRIKAGPFTCHQLSALLEEVAHTVTIEKMIEERGVHWDQVSQVAR